MGYAKGLHKIDNFQLAIGNLPADERMAHDNILLYGACHAKVMKKHGAARVLCGVRADGTQLDEPCLGRDMQKLAEGVWIELSNPPAGIPRRVRLRAWILPLCADFMEAQSLLPFVESPAAHHPCRCCDWDQSSPLAHKPFSFLDAAANRRQCSHPSPSWTMRTWPQLKRALEVPESQWKGTSYEHGLNKRVFAMDPASIPLVNPVTVAPQDVMHLLMDGITRHELAWLHYVLLSRKFISWEQLEAAYKSYRWPKGVRIPPLPKKIKEGVAGNTPRPDATLGMSASQVMYVALHR